MMRRPNVLMVMLDSARPELLSCFGGPDARTPNIDAVAQGGWLFEKAISPSAWTFPVMASVFTGMLPTKHGGHDEHRLLDSHYPTMAEVFARGGYDTACFSDVPYVGPMTRLSRGFRTMSNQRGGQVSLWNKALKAAARAHRSFARHYVKTNETRVLIGETLRWLSDTRDPERPFFLYVHSDETHLPLAPPPAYRERFAKISPARMRQLNQDKQLFVAGKVRMTAEDLADLKRLAVAEAAFFDHWFGRLLDYLRRQNLLDDTIIVVAADHGDNFGEHGLLRHGLCLYDTLTHVPLIIRVPGQAARRAPQLVSLIDVFPTLVRLAGLDDPETFADLQGQDLAAAIRERRFNTYAFSELYRPSQGLWERTVPDFMPEFRRRYDRVLRAIRSQDHKLIWSNNGGHELFDLRVDPGETNNLYESQPQKAAEMMAALEDWLASFPHARAATVPQEEAADEGLMSRLRDLGYV